MAETAEGLDGEATRAYVAALVTQQLGVPGFKLEPQQVGLGGVMHRAALLLLLQPPWQLLHSAEQAALHPRSTATCRPPFFSQVFLVSARDALCARCALRPGASQADVDALRRVAFGKAWQRVTDEELIRWGGFLAL